MRSSGATGYTRKPNSELPIPERNVTRPDQKLAISHCETVKDFISRELFTDILESEEEHIDWLQTQMRLIEQMGIENFVQLQTKPNESGS